MRACCALTYLRMRNPRYLAARVVRLFSVAGDMISMDWCFCSDREQS